jgi:WD40 repeat protein
LFTLLFVITDHIIYLGINDIEMCDLLSMSEDVLQEVYQYFKLENVRRLPMHTWLRIRQELQALIVERSNGGVHWYHRQLWETAKERFEGNYQATGQKPSRIYLHKIMAIYYANLDPDNVRNTKTILSQPLLIPTNTNDIVVSEEEKERIWEQDSKINSRRCTEALHHLVHARMIEEAVDEICNLNHVCAYARAGVGFEILPDLNLLHSMIKELYQQDYLPTSPRLSVHYGEEKMMIPVGSGVKAVRHMEKAHDVVDSHRKTMLTERFQHYYKWLKADMSSISRDPHKNIFTTGLHQPMSSIVRKEVEEKKFRTRFNNAWKVKCLGGLKDFGADILTLSGHSEAVATVACLQTNNNRIISGSYDMTIKFWNMTNGECESTLEGHSSYVNYICLSDDESKLFTGDGEGNIKIWDIAMEECLLTIHAHDTIISGLCRCKDGKMVISVAPDSTIKLWKIEDGQNIDVIRCDSEFLRSAYLSLDNTMLIVGTDDNNIIIVDMTTRQHTHTLEGHTDRVNTLTMTSDADRAISGSSDTTIKIWDMLTRECVLTCEGHSAAVNAVVLTLDNCTIISGSDDKSIKVWSIATGECVSTYYGHSVSITWLCMPTDNDKIISASFDNTIKVWNKSISNTETMWDGYSDGVISLDKSADGSIIVSGSTDGLVRIWDGIRMEFQSILGDHCSFAYVCISFDGQEIVSGGGDNIVRVWNKRECIAVLEGHEDAVTAVSISLDKTRIMSGSTDCFIRIWDGTSYDCLCICGGDSSFMNITSLVMAKDNSKIISGVRNKDLNVWDTKTGACIMTLEGHEDSIGCVDICDDIIASASDDKTIKVWRLSTGQCLLTLEGHSQAVNTVSISGDGRRMASGSFDGSVKIWNLESGICEDCLEGHLDYVYAVKMSRDGEKVISASFDKTIKIWETLK